MPVITIETEINAPIEVCFDLARSVDAHVKSLKKTKERAVEGVTKGMLHFREHVTWEARHFGIRQRLTSRVTIYDRPHHFRDSQLLGIFRSFDHDHIFTRRNGITVMKDVFEYHSPLGWLGRCADWLFLERYLRRLLETRAASLKAQAEAVSVTQ
jgi:ligand-binding SRPBCC domain-containing protein